jgi:hypothetical protein
MFSQFYGTEISIEILKEFFIKFLEDRQPNSHEFRKSGISIFTGKLNAQLGNLKL